MTALTEVPRHLTAMARTGLSRPISLALELEVLTPGSTFFDFGCGRGGDVRRLTELGLAAEGWDPSHSPTAAKRAAHVVNLGFVLNVIEDPSERVAVLREAWTLAEEALIVAVRPDWEERQVAGRPWRDGVVTSKGTFQKFYAQNDIRELLAAVVSREPVPISPGIFFVFKSEQRANDFRAAYIRTRTSRPRASLSQMRFDEHRSLLHPLMEFFERRGRLPTTGELPEEGELVRVFGSIRAAFGLMRRVNRTYGWDGVARAAADDLAVFLALAAFQGRPRMSELSPAMQADVRALFGSFKRACATADEMLFSLRDWDRVESAMRSSPIGKLLPSAFYVHVSALSRLAPELRLYEGCGRALVGAVESANLVKLSREDRRVSYLAYPEFDTSAHPPLAASVRVDLQTFHVKYREYRTSANPPVLHRKECFVGDEYPGREKFARLTTREENAGLLEDTHTIGTRDGWGRVLDAKGFKLAGHRLLRTATGTDPPAAATSDDRCASAEAPAGA